MHGFKIKVKKEQKYLVKLIWEMRWMINVFCDWSSFQCSDL